MKVKIGDKIYDAEDVPVMVILSTKDKKNIATMPAGNSKYCSFPSTMPSETVSAWMKEGIE